ncbi:hypothetical protein [Brachybacterium hainanense]|uniref:Replication protein n=1 Tax=Brachybacterium hainanense TaxID=1541174 RepID=A0ABV6R975_9MICO
MAWFKADDQLPFHPKVLAAGNAAMGLWIRAGTWSSSQLTDGFIPSAIANAMANECDADALVDAGLWDRVEGQGYRFHDWSDFQPSAEQEREKREKRKRAGQKGAAARWGSNPDSKSHSKPHDTTDDASHGKADGKTMPRSRPRSHVSPTETRPDVEQVCELLADLCQQTASNGRRPTITKAWRDEARRLIDLDSRTVTEIERIARWALGDPFWVGNIRSMPKLRAQFEQLSQQAQRPTRQQQPRPNRDVTSGRSLVEAHQRLFGENP